MTVPLVALLAYMACTYCPLIYRFMPFLGELKIVLVAGVVLVISFLATSQKYTNISAYKDTIVHCWAVFLLFMTMGLLVSIDRGLTLGLIQTNLKFFIVFLIMVKVVDTYQRLETVLRVLVLSGSSMAASAIYNSVFDPSSLNAESVANLTGGFRAIALDGGIFGDPNDLALLLNSILPFAMYLFLLSSRKALPILCAVMLVAGTVATHSRAGFLGLCLIAVSFVVQFGGKQKKHVMVILAIALAMWSFAPDSYRERISSLNDWEEGGAEKTGRMNGWLLAVNEGFEHPLLGLGAGASGYVMGAGLSDWHAVHNSFAQVIVEVGFLGFTAYLMLYVSSVRYRNIGGRNKQIGPDRLGVLSKVVAIAIVSYGLTAFFTPQAYSPLLYTLTGLAVITKELIRKEARVSSPSSSDLLEQGPDSRNIRGAWT